MIQSGTWLNVTDNTGIKKVQCIRVLGGTRRRYASLGDVITLTAKKVQPHGNFKKGQVVRGVIVRTRQAVRRPDGSYIRFDDNAVIIVDSKNQPQATRIFGPVARELKEKGFSNVVTLAPEVL